MTEEVRRLLPGAYVGGPLYREVRRLILADLKRGIWQGGERLPTEPVLAKHFGISISTVRKALDVLVEEHILVRQAGRGTFVASHSGQAFELFFQFVDDSGMRTEVTAELMSFAIRPADAPARHHLLLQTEDQVARITNLRRLRGDPVMVDRLWVPLTVFPNLSRAQFAARSASIYGFYQETFGVTVVRVEEKLVAVPADAAAAAALGLAKGSPLLRVERLAFSYDDRPIEYRQRFVNSLRCAYRNVTGLRSSS